MLSEYNSEETLFLQGLQHQKKYIASKIVGKETGKQDMFPILQRLF